MKIKRYIETVNTGVALFDKFKLLVFLLIDKAINIKTLKINVKIENEDGIFFCENIQHVLMYSIHREEALREYFKVEDNKVFIDIGANIGKYSFMVANRSPKAAIIAVEPYKEAVEIIRRNIKLNSLENIDIVDKVVSTTPGNIEFFVNKKVPTRNSIFKEEITGQSKYVGEEVDADIEVEKLPSIKLDDVVKDVNKVSLIKVDVQGAELDVLKSGRRVLENSRPKIIFEAWDKKYLESIKEYLSSFDYTVSPIDRFNYIAKHNEK